MTERRIPFSGGQPWGPTMMTAPLTTDPERFVSDGYKLLEIVRLVWTTPEGGRIELDEWQEDVIIAALERYPADWPEERLRGRLRYRTVVISLGRQNGKSVLGAIFALYGLLMHDAGPEVISVASTVDQANIIYKRVRHVIDSYPFLRRRFKATGTRGITTRAGAPGSYVVKTGKEESLQGIPISLCLADELHLWKDETYNAVVFGTSARADGLILGITTAGDDKSELLKRLYKVGKATISGGEDGDPRMGFFLWEAEAHLKVTDPQFVIQGNPAVACGRLDVDQELNAIKSMPEHQARRYRGNQFVASEASWLATSTWHGLDKGAVPEKTPFVLSVERTENWTGATITASARVGNKVHTEVVASYVNPSLETLEEAVLDLYRRTKPMKVFMRQVTLRDLAARLRERGVEVEYLTQAQFQNVCATAYALIAEDRVVHADDWVVGSQMPRAVAKNVGEGWIISTRDSSGEVDAVIATVVGLYGAEVTKPKAPALVIG